MAEWTKEPEHGAYWFSMGGPPRDFDIVWVHFGNVWDVPGLKVTRVVDDVARGGMFYGPLDLPPPPPKPETKSCTCCCCKCKRDVI